MNYRGPVAEVLFVADFAVAQATRARRNIRVFARPTDAELQQLSPFSRAATLMVEVGECVARADRESARALILSDVGDDQEKQAFSALTPSLSGCIPPGFELKISKFQLRGYIAEGAYRAAVTTQGV
jgi:hypothetical protein